MASRPKLQRLIMTLKDLATEELGRDAEPIDFVVQRIGAGQSVTALAHEVAEVMGEPASRSWLSWRFNHLTPSAKQRIAGARHDAAQVIRVGSYPGRRAPENNRQAEGSRPRLTG